MKAITIIIPVYNEEDSLARLIARLDSLADTQNMYRFEYLFVDDGSKDGTLPLLKQYAAANPRVSYVTLSRNFGQEAAMFAGLDHADGDAVIIIDADLQDPPELVPQMIQLWEQGYDDVYARRNNRKGETWLKKTTASLYYRMLQRSTKVEIQRDTGNFRLLDRRCVLALRQMREHERQAKALFSWIGYRKKEITYDRDPRIDGQSKWSYPALVNLAINGVTSFTIAPLRFASISGFVISFVALVYIIIIIVQTLFTNNHLSGWPAIMCVVLFLGGIQLVSLGIIGEYIGRIFNETKNRPIYLIDDYHAGGTTTSTPSSQE
ncbi:MAG: glycosyltransferase family 2 protein [Propionibacteriaceae bacterium]|nr:glycosyltransferase family 2 protein [Propionibacteriaceae bacterium]